MKIKIRMKKEILFLLVIILHPAIIKGQNLVSKHDFRFETGFIVANNGYVPFGLRTNTNGLVPDSGPIIYQDVEIKRGNDSLYSMNGQLKKFSISYGLKTRFNVGKKKEVRIGEAYLGMRYGAFELYGGRRFEIQGIVDSSNSSGSYIWSGNALPLPRINIAITKYTPITKNGIISIKGNYAHGWFDNGVVIGSMLHQKSFYMRIGKKDWKTKFYGGFNHQVQWGGKPEKPYIDPPTGRLITTFSSGIDTYVNVVTGISLNKNDAGVDLDGVPYNEAFNRAGNHLGTVDIGMEFFAKGSDILIYRQSIFEDGSLFYLNNITDGLYGVSWTNRRQNSTLKKITVEHLETRSQGGETGSGNTIPQLRGRDNYFNNRIYSNGWTYKGQVIGSPLLATISQLNLDLISQVGISSRLPRSYVISNRISSWYMGVEYGCQILDFITRITHISSLGNYSIPMDVKNTSLYQGVRYGIREFTVKSDIGVDIGNLLRSKFGVQISISRGI